MFRAPGFYYDTYFRESFYTPTKPRTKKQLFSWLEARDEVMNFELDIALWYAYFSEVDEEALDQEAGDWNTKADNRKPTTLEIEFCRRLTGLLYYGGLMYLRDDRAGTGDRPVMNHHFWANSTMPIAAALSHGGRILIQVSNEKNIWPWLWQTTSETLANRLAKDYKRKASTHKVGLRKIKEVLVDGNAPSKGAGDENTAGACPRWIIELKQNPKKAMAISSTPITKKPNSLIAGQLPGGNDYGINTSLGVWGKKNPFSGNTVSASGAHGHLFFRYCPPTRQKWGALLVGLEDSAPPSFHSSRTAGQTFHKHTILGGTETYTGTGGKKWDVPCWEAGGTLSEKKKITDPARFHSGPMVRYESLYLDATHAPNFRTFLNGIRDNFTPDLLNRPGVVPQFLQDYKDTRALKRRLLGGHVDLDIITPGHVKWVKPTPARCMDCNAKLKKGKRHHCRLTGKVYCEDCAFQAEIIPKGRTRQGRTTNPVQGPIWVHYGAFRRVCGIDWQKDADHDTCQICGTRFTFTTRRHHCRYCGRIICDACSKKRLRSPKVGYLTEVRICDTCYGERMPTRMG